MKPQNRTLRWFALCAALFAPAGLARAAEGDAPMRIPRADLEWMEAAAKAEIMGSRRVSESGVTLFTPDGVGNYGALWTRDFAYMVPLFDLFEPEDVRKAVDYLVEGVSDDHTAPDRRQVDGVTVYSAGGLGNPVARPPLDNAAFLVRLVYLYHKNAGGGFAEARLDTLYEAMKAIPRRDGLVWNDPDNPHSPYGFTDTVGKTGALLFCSLLDWRAWNELAELAGEAGLEPMAESCRQRALEVERGLPSLIDPETGLYFAASDDCRQIDVWGNAFAVAIGYPAGEERTRTIENFFANRYGEVIEKGQVRHLIEGEFWNRMLIPIAEGDYQNGAYWGTPSGWVLKVLAPRHPRLAEKMLRDLLGDYRERGIHEWVNGDRTRLPRYVASIANPLAAVRDLIKEGLAVVED